MALVTTALPCHPPLQPLPLLTSAPSKHNGEGVLGVGRWVGQHRVDIAHGKGRECRSSCVGSLVLILEPRSATYCQTQMLFLTLSAEEWGAISILHPLSYSSGLLSTSGIYQDLPRWVQACLCSSEIALYNLRNVEAWPAHDGQERWTVSVISSTHTDTHRGPTPPFISIARWPSCLCDVKQRVSCLVSFTGSVWTCVWEMGLFFFPDIIFLMNEFKPSVQKHWMSLEPVGENPTHFIFNLSSSKFTTTHLSQGVFGQWSSYVPIWLIAYQENQTKCRFCPEGFTLRIYNYYI